MKQLSLALSLLLFSFVGVSQKYKPADAGSKVHFIVKNFGIPTGGDLSGLTGDINFVPANSKACSFTVSVKVNTIDTDNGSRDKDLKGKKYFDADSWPVITIQSTRIDRTNKSGTGWYYFTGTLTLHGITKPIAFPFQAKEQGKDFLFVGGFDINRLDYTVGSSSAVLSNNVKVSLSVLARKS